MSVKLIPITKENWRKTLKIQVAPGQLAFVADHEPVSLVILAKCYVGAGGATWYPLAIEQDNEIVGIVALAVVKTKCWVFHLVIDAKHQGKGLGTKAVELLKTYVSNTLPESETIKITVHPENAIAKKIYLRSGFVETGEIENSETVMQFKLVS